MEADSLIENDGHEGVGHLSKGIGISMGYPKKLSMAGMWSYKENLGCQVEREWDYKPGFVLQSLKIL